MVDETLPVSSEPIDRLAEKVQSLVGVLERTRSELARTAEDNIRLSLEIDELREKLVASEDQSAQAVSLQAERDRIRVRVTEMLDQLENLSL